MEAQMSASKKTSIYCTCGIYDTVYTVRDYGSKIVITAPYVRWVNNNGSLDFAKTTVSDISGIALVRAMVDNDELVVDGVDNNIGHLTMDDVINGHRANIIA
jgi:hypothetical protein